MRAFGNEFRTEGSLMEYTEREIYELQALLRAKVGDYVPVIKKAMDIEDFLYREALYKNGLDRNGNVWESNDAINTYMESLENIKKLIKTKDDFGKIFQIADIRQFYLQLTSLRIPANKKKDIESPHTQTVKKEKSSKARAKASQSTTTTKKRVKAANKATSFIPTPIPSSTLDNQFSSHLVQNDPPAVLKPPELDENFIEQDDDLMGFGLDFEDIVDNNTMKNISAWDSISLTPVDSVGTNTVESWSDAAEERRSQQKLSANMEFHRVSQLVELKRARERDSQNISNSSPLGDTDLEALREREKKLRESEGPELHLMQNFESIQSLSDWP